MKIIEILIKHGAKCINDERYSTLNTAIICSKHYIAMFNDRNNAEHNAIKVIDTVIKNGGTPINHQFIGNTLTIIMDMRNLNILRFINAAIDLNLVPTKHIYRLNILEYALTASQNSRNPEFFRTALKHGALLKNADTVFQILRSDVVSILDCVIFGGKHFLASFWEQIDKIIHHMIQHIEENKIKELFEIIICSSGSFTNEMRGWFRLIITNISIHNNSETLWLWKEFFNDYESVWSGDYKVNRSDDARYEKIIELKHRLESRTKRLIKTAYGERMGIEHEILSILICCMNIIYDYLDAGQKFDAVDWSKY